LFVCCLFVNHKTAAATTVTTTTAEQTTATTTGLYCVDVCFFSERDTPLLRSFSVCVSVTRVYININTNKHKHCINKCSINTASFQNLCTPSHGRPSGSAVKERAQNIRKRLLCREGKKIIAIFDRYLSLCRKRYKIWP